MQCVPTLIGLLFIHSLAYSNAQRGDEVFSSYNSGTLTSKSNSTNSPRCSTDIDCAPQPHTICVRGECQCKVDYNQYNGRCVNGSIEKSANMVCSNNDNCKEYDRNSECIGRQCQCKSGYEMRNGSCTAVHTSQEKRCQSNNDCTWKGSKAFCSSNQCFCYKGYEEDSKKMCNPERKSLAVLIAVPVVVVMLMIGSASLLYYKRKTWLPRFFPARYRSVPREENSPQNFLSDSTRLGNSRPSSLLLEDHNIVPQVIYLERHRESRQEDKPPKMKKKLSFNL